MYNFVQLLLCILPLENGDKVISRLQLQNTQQELYNNWYYEIFFIDSILILSPSWDDKVISFQLQNW